MRAEQYRRLAECWRPAQMIPPNAQASLLEIADEQGRRPKQYVCLGRAQRLAQSPMCLRPGGDACVLGVVERAGKRSDPFTGRRYGPRITDRWPAVLVLSHDQLLRLESTR